MDEEKLDLKSKSSQSQTATAPASRSIKASSQSGTQRNKKAKRLPWNTEVLNDRFTPQPYPVQLVDACTSFNNLNDFYNKRTNILIFMKSPEWKKYLQLMAIKQYALNLRRDQLQSGKKSRFIFNQ